MLLGRILKDIFLSKRNKNTEGHQNLPLAHFEHGGNIIVIIAGSEGDFVGHVCAEILKPIQAQATGITYIDARKPGWIADIAEAVNSPVWFVVSYFGVGKNISYRTDYVEHNYWTKSGIPILQLFGDIPAYYPRAHSQDQPNWVNIYGHPEHAEYFKKWFLPKGLVGVSPIFLLDKLEPNEVDFKEKLSGKIIFPKNGNSPYTLIDYWRLSLPKRISTALENICETATSSENISKSVDIGRIIIDHFSSVNVDITEPRLLFHFLVAQIDDYLRRVKSTLIVNSLLDFPIEVRGVNWEHISFSGKKAQLVPNSSYAVTRTLIQNSLAILDMSPNTERVPHDRVLRAAARHTAFITNQQLFFRSHFERQDEFTFSFTADSIREKVDIALSNPARMIALGRHQAETMQSLSPDENYSNFILTLIDACALACQGRPLGTQIFVDYP